MPGLFKPSCKCVNETCKTLLTLDLPLPTLAYSHKSQEYSQTDIQSLSSRSNRKLAKLDDGRGLDFLKAQASISTTTVLRKIKTGIDPLSNNPHSKKLSEGLAYIHCP